MNRIVTLAACVSFGMLVVALADSGGAEQTDAVVDDPQTSAGEMHGEVRENMAAFLWCPKDRFRVGEPIPLSFGLTLVGPGIDVHDDETANLRIRVFKPEPIMDPENYSWFEVTGPDGENVPYQGPYSSVPLYAPSEDNSVVLRHGDVMGRIHDNLADGGRFSLTTPGTYTVRWGYATHTPDGIWSGGPLRSNEVMFEIVDGL